MRLLLVLLALLLFAAAPAMAQDGTAVGEGQVITDIATETEPPPGEDDGTDIPPVDDGQPAAEPPEPDASGRRGEVHVLDSATESDAPATPAPAPSTSPPATAAASPAAAPARPVAASAKNLPFTGVDAGPLVLIGLALLGAGGGLLAVLRQPVQ